MDTSALGHASVSGPNGNAVPSEATIEQIANHQILNHVGPYTAWFYVPTRREEQHLSYDASLQGHKVLVIQYKRMHPVKARGKARIDIPAAQFWTLVGNFPRGPSPYVFYNFGTYRTYSALAQEFAAGHGQRFAERTVFVNAHDIPSKPTSLGISIADGQVSVILRPQRQMMQMWSLTRLVSQFLSCNVGLHGPDLPGPPADFFRAIGQRGRGDWARRGPVGLSNLNVLVAKVK